MDGPVLIRELMDLGVDLPVRNRASILVVKVDIRKPYRPLQGFTGREIERVLVHSIQTHPNITVLQNHIAIDLITEHNLVNQENLNERMMTFTAGARMCSIIQACCHQVSGINNGAQHGRLRHVYAHTSNPLIATATESPWPTVQERASPTWNSFSSSYHAYHPDAPSFLISEAVRGFGAYLRLGNGERFMNKYDERLELAPRDIVARAMIMS